jgi:hypothetical protein
MTKEEFINTLVDGQWEWADHEEQGIKGVAFQKEIGGGLVKYHISDEGIERTTKEQIQRKLGSHDVTQMTRIVGYYSRVSNWNKSKLGELNDRRSGSYGV